MLSPAPIRAVVIGASAGGIGALRVLLPALPATLAVPVLVVVHLPPRQPSVLCDIFAPMCFVPVREAADKELLTAGGIWFAPPDYHLLVEASTEPGSAASIALSIDEAVLFSRPSIDVLFESAAEVYREGLLAVVLTGANSDGARGAELVRALGGTVAVQSPESAEIAVMPEAAIARARPQFIGSVEELASFVVRLVSGGTQ
jgi:two-component system chemotaxis response regulator CheB